MDKPAVLQPGSLPDQGAEPFRQLLQESLQHLLEGQMTEFLGAVPGERTQARTGYRAGHVKRRLATRAGLLELRVPRDRARRFSSDLLERYPRQEAAFISALGQMAAEGLTTDNVRALAEALCGHAPSAHVLDQIQEGLRNALTRHAGGADDTPAAMALEATAPAEREAVAASDGTPPVAPVAPDPDASSFAPRHAQRGRPARWMAGLGGTLVAAGLLFLGTRWMGDASPELPRAAADFSGAPDPVVHAAPAVHAVHVDRMDPADPTLVGARPSPAAPLSAPPPRLSSRLQLTGVVATNPTDGGGLALIAIDGGLARVIRVGAIVDGELSLQAVSADRAMLGPAGGPATLVLELGTSAASPGGVLRADGAQRSWAAAVATAPAFDAAKTVQPPTVLAGNMPPPMTVDADVLQPTTVVDLVPAAVPAARPELQSLSHAERRRQRRLTASR